MAPNGSAAFREEKSALVQGRGRYVNDVRTADCLHLKFHRSTVARGQIREITLPGDQQAPGDYFFRAEDLGVPDLTVPFDRSGVLNPARPLLARDAVRFVGEPVVAVLSTDEYRAEDLSHGVRVLIDEMEPLVDPFAAIGSDELVHNSLETNVLFEESFASDGSGGVFGDNELQRIELALRSERVTAIPLEPRGVIASYGGGKLTVWASTQSPHLLQRILAQYLSLELPKVAIRVPKVGGGFGLKAHIYPEEIIAAILAYRLRTTVRWIEDRVEDFTSACHARDQHIRVAAMFNADGLVKGIDADFTVDIGAYGVYAHGHLLEALGTPGMVPGPYALEAYRYKVRAVATNKAPLGAYRGVGLPIATFTHERIMDAVASALGLTQEEIRLRNLIPTSEAPYRSLTGQTYESFDFERALALVCRHIDNERDVYQQQWGEDWIVGTGIALYIESVAPGSDTFKKRGMTGLAGFDQFQTTLNDDGSLSLATTLPSIGQGNNEQARRLMQGYTGLGFQDLHVEEIDTSEQALAGNGTFASRSAVVSTQGVERSIAALQEQIAEYLAESRQLNRKNIEAKTDFSFSIGDDTLVSREDAHLIPRKYRVATVTVDPENSVHPSGAHGCVLGVHRYTGAVRIFTYAVADDCGIRLNPEAIKNQLQGAVGQACSEALIEAIEYDTRGQVTNPSFVNYLMLGAGEVPRIAHYPFVPTRARERAEVKGTGEAATLAPSAAITNAVSDALGVQCNAIPIRREWILSQLTEAT